MVLRRTRFALLLFVFALPPAARAFADDAKVLRLARPDISCLDPQQISDLYSTRVANAIFEGLYQFDYLATPARVVPNTAAAMPEITDGGRTWTIRIQPAILFAADPAFKAKPRELVAEDYVYSIKRRLDPNLKRGGDPAFTDLLLGARPVVDAAKKSGKLRPELERRGIRHHRYTVPALNYTYLNQEDPVVGGNAPERVALRRAIAMQVYSVGNAFTQPWLLGYYPSPFGFTWKYMDIDLARKKAAGK